MDEKQIAFIICVNDDVKYAECRYYLDRLIVPEGYEKDIVAVTGAPSMAAGYNAGMQSSNAKYKVYLHQDVFIINKNFIADMLAVFCADEQVGLIGMVGTEDLGEDAYAIIAWNYGKVIDISGEFLDLPPKDGVFQEVEALDGLLLATQYDLPWREDLFDGWDFYDISQCMEFKRAGYRVAVPYQKNPWCCHDNAYNKMGRYHHYRKLFIREYSEMGNFRIREAALTEIHQEKDAIFQKIAEIFAAGHLRELRIFFKSTDCQGFLFLRDYEAMVHIDDLEKQNQSKLRLYSEGAEPEQILHKFQLLKYAIKRIEYSADTEEDKIFLLENYSKYAILDVCGRYAIYKDRIYMTMGDVLIKGDGADWALDQIYTELKKDYRNYALYYMLGLSLKEKNINQAFLCMENAEFFCGNAEDKVRIQKEKAVLAESGAFCVKPVSIVVLSYNLKQVCIQCIESIRKHNKPDTYEIIVVDNASSDGVYEWLKEQKDIKLIRNEENLGFPKGSNQGIKAAGSNDILLLNNDIEIQPNTIFCLRMGLYETSRTGAAGCVSNYAGNGQTIDCTGYTPDDCRAYAKTCNVPCKNPYENKSYLGGFALLLRQGIIEQIGMFDERFSPGYYEDNDLGLRIAKAGYRQLLCKNSFVLHYGSASFGWEAQKRQLEINAAKLRDKWGFDSRYYMNVRDDLIKYIQEDKDTPIHVLEVGCGLGSTLARIQALWPNAVVKGVEYVKDIAEIGKSVADISQGDIESMDLPYEKEYFDYMIFGDVLEHLRDPWGTIKRLKLYLKKSGHIIASIPNAAHMSVIVGLLKGTAAYQDAGILDKTHLRFFTKKTAMELFEKNGFSVEEMGALLDGSCYVKESEIIKKVLELPGISDEESFIISQYLIKAVKVP